MNRAALYVRVSTEEQAKEGFSIAAQREKLTWFAASQGWEIVGVFADEGFSAKSMNRPALQRLLDQVRAKCIDTVLVYRLDRLTRSVMDLYQLLAEWERYQVTFRSCTEVYDTTTAIGRLFITLVAALAQWERENLSERVKMGMEQMAQEEKRPGGPSPYGYRLDSGQLVVEPEEAAVVQHIFSEYAASKTVRQIAQMLNERGIVNRSGTAWSPTTLAHMLQNHVYYGALRWNYAAGGQRKNRPADWVIREGTHEAIIDKQLFLLAERIMQQRRQQHPRALASPFLFSGVLRCGCCHTLLIGKTVAAENYYACKNRRSHGCSTAIIDEQDLVALLLAAIAPLSPPPPLIFAIYDGATNKPFPLKELTGEDIFSFTEYAQLLQSLPALWQIASRNERKQLIALLIKEMVVEGSNPPTLTRLEFH